MSGPILTPGNGATFAVREDLGEPMINPATQHSNQLQPPSYWTGPLPYYGDFQLTPNGTAPMRLVIEFDPPIKQVRTTAQFVGGSGLALYAVVDESQFGAGNTFIAAKNVTWTANVSGTRTLTYEPGFRFLVIQTIASSPGMGSMNAGPTFRNTFYFDELPVVAPIIAPQPDLRIPRGTGRLLSASWPLIATTNTVGGSMLVRPHPGPEGGLGGLSMVQTVYGAPPPGNGNVLYQGVRALRIVGGNGTGVVFFPLTGALRFGSIYPALERPVGSIDGLDEMACWRVMGLMAFEVPGGPITQDCGLIVGAGANKMIRGGAEAGFSFGLADVDTLVLTTRAVDGGPAIEHIIQPGLDLAELHVYELRILSATTLAEAALKVMIDEVVVLHLQWGPGTELPIPHAGTAYGFYPGVGNRGGSPDFTTRLYLASGGWHLHCAMTEDGLL